MKTGSGQLLRWCLAAPLLVWEAAAVHSPTYHEIGSSAGSNGFIRAGLVDTRTAETELVKQLEGTFRSTAASSRLAELEAALRPMFAALPKDRDGNLGHAAVRYALHRLLAYQHGWWMKGLEPDGGPRNATKFMSSLKEWVPSYLQQVLERRLGWRGFDLQELAVIAATLEDLVHREAIERLQALYKLHEQDVSASLEPEFAQSLIDQYFLVYYKGGNWKATSAGDALRRLSIFKTNFHEWAKVEDWLRSLQQNITRADEGIAPSDAAPATRLSFEGASRIVEAIGNDFASFNEEGCRDLKSTLLEMEDSRPGRVLLARFYERALTYSTRWDFTEKIDYLRAVGALDESVPGKPSIIIPNYVVSRPQCLEASHFYAVCCRMECEDLLSKLEQEIAAPSAEPERITKLVADLSSATVAAPRPLSASLLAHLQEIANFHGGQVPLHGRLFAQWMHHAFPADCPYPHEAWTTRGPLTPDEWMRDEGADKATASQAEMECIVFDNCTDPAPDEAGGDVSDSSASQLESAARDASVLLEEAPSGDPEAGQASSDGPLEAAAEVVVDDELQQLEEAAAAATDNSSQDQAETSSAADEYSSSATGETSTSPSDSDSISGSDSIGQEEQESASGGAAAAESQKKLEADATTEDLPWSSAEELLEDEL
eukprot:TRINITY_DN42265_c0_g1_i2.p1 TRINITY_DN42265_c0_g1~~TRINITY_DN42265_c0_g1_i2.p1  ORF type:complete len:659 (+),score=166.06 TRINITY_DN42265_c0_g1_i2:94-2070(+)